MKKVILLSLLTLNTFGINIEEVNKTLASIEDEKLREVVALKLSDKIAASIINNHISNKDDISIDAKSTHSNIQDREVANVADKTMSQKKLQTSTKSISDSAVVKSDRAFDDITFNIGLSGYAANIKEGQVDGTFTGGAFKMGAGFNKGPHKARLGLTVIGASLDSVESEGLRYNVSSYDTELAYRGAGAELSYSYFINDKVGLGAYVIKTSGEVELCDYELCSVEDASSTETGLRVDFKIANWNPYIAVGKVSFKDTSSRVSGTSAYVGLLNFEF